MLMLGVAACSDPSMTLYRTSLLTLDIRLPPERTTDLLAQLRTFAHQHGFGIWMRTNRSGIGSDRAFELRRRDIWIEGGNPLRDIPAVIPMPSNGRPVAPMEIDQGRFVVDFYAGDVEPSDAALEEVVSAFIASMETVAGVTVAPEEQTPLGRDASPP